MLVSGSQVNWVWVRRFPDERTEHETSTTTLLLLPKQKLINVVVVRCPLSVSDHFINLISTKSQIVTSQHESIPKLQNEKILVLDT